MALAHYAATAAAPINAGRLAIERTDAVILTIQVRNGSHTFDVAGEYTYFRSPHEAAGMVARLTVES